MSAEAKTVARKTPRKVLSHGAPCSTRPGIDYALATAIPTSFKEWLNAALERSDVRRVCELGAGRRPLVPIERLQRREIDYIIVDVDPRQLARVPEGYRTELVDISSPMCDSLGRFDLILSRYVLEHVVRPEAFHAGVCRQLAAGGRALHLFSTLYSPPMIANRWLPEFVSRRLVAEVQPERLAPRGHGKFKAYYRWCRGPTTAQLRRLEGVGLEVERYRGFFGHSGTSVEGPGYYDVWPWLARRHADVARWLVAHPKAWLTSHGMVELRKRAL